MYSKRYFMEANDNMKMAFVLFIPGFMCCMASYIIYR